MYLAWLTALVSALGSLVLSEIMGLVPCVLCWYQRILLYPLVVILFVAIIRKDRGVYHYVWPFSALGMVFAFYHFLIQKGVITEALVPCKFGVSCTTKYFEYFGFINIPFLSLAAFAFITFCIFLFHKHHSKI